MSAMNQSKIINLGPEKDNPVVDELKGCHKGSGFKTVIGVPHVSRKVHPDYNWTVKLYSSEGDLKVSPMNGSKICIAENHKRPAPRNYEYDYVFMGYLGRWAARKMFRENLKTLMIKTNNPRFKHQGLLRDNNSSGRDNCCQKELYSSFVSEIKQCSVLVSGEEFSCVCSVELDGKQLIGFLNLKDIDDAHEEMMKIKRVDEESVEKRKTVKHAFEEMCYSKLLEEVEL